MLLNLKAEYTRKNIEPYIGVMKALQCSEKTARNKINGVTPMTIREAVKIIKTDFPNSGFTIDYLFYESIWKEGWFMYIVISKFYDDKTIVSEPIYLKNAEPQFEHKTEYDRYIDVFDTKEEAFRFYKNQLEEPA